MSKYHNRKTEVNGIKFDSMAEGRRYQELLILERAHKIKNLELQPKYLLREGFRKCPDCKKRPLKGTVCPECGAKLLVFRPRYYVGDFRYIDCATNEEILEDVKGSRGFLTDIFKIKWHIFEDLYPDKTIRLVVMKPERVKQSKKPALMVEPVFTGGKKRVYS